MQSSLKIRLAEESDILVLAELWHDKMQIIQQFNNWIRLTPTAKQDWSIAASEQFKQVGNATFVAESNEIVGFISGMIRRNEVGFFPQKIGVIREVVLDMHTYQGGAGQELVRALQNWFTEQGITQIQVFIPHNFAPEEAFWQSMVTKQISTTVWLK